MCSIIPNGLSNTSKQPSAYQFLMLMRGYSLCRPGKHATAYSTCECSGSTCEYTDSNTQVACDEGYTIQVLNLHFFLLPTLKDASKEYSVQKHHVECAVLPFTALHMHCWLLYEDASKEV